jgi:hypothetical protein
LLGQSDDRCALRSGTPPCANTPYQATAIVPLPLCTRDMTSAAQVDARCRYGVLRIVLSGVHAGPP